MEAFVKKNASLFSNFTPDHRKTYQLKSSYLLQNIKVDDGNVYIDDLIQANLYYVKGTMFCALWITHSNQSLYVQGTSFSKRSMYNDSATALLNAFKAVNIEFSENFTKKGESGIKDALIAVARDVLDVDTDSLNLVEIQS